MKNFRVTAKCGHVGRSRYYKGEFYVEAKNGKEAAARVREFARVKSNHKDAILNVEELSLDEFEEGRKNKYSNLHYYKCTSRQDQNKIFHKIEDTVYSETNRNRSYTKVQADRLEKLKVLRREERKMKKYNYYSYEFMC